ncbi:MAG TPA: hypothetical protein ACFYD3_01525 [Candidatus Hypogeohydataceae bacterium YC41]
MILSQLNLKYLVAIFAICVAVFIGYVLGAKEVSAHKVKYQISQGFSTVDQAVNFLNVEQPHEFHIIPDCSKGQYAIIYEE